MVFSEDLSAFMTIRMETSHALHRVNARETVLLMEIEVKLNASLPHGNQDASQRLNSTLQKSVMID